MRYKNIKLVILFLLMIFSLEYVWSLSSFGGEKKDCQFNLSELKEIKTQTGDNSPLSLEEDLLKYMYYHKKTAEKCVDVFLPGFDIPANFVDPWTPDWVENKCITEIISDEAKLTEVRDLKIDYESLVSLNISAANLWKKMKDCFTGDQAEKAEKARRAYFENRWPESKEGQNVTEELFLLHANIMSYFDTAYFPNMVNAIEQFDIFNITQHPGEPEQSYLKRSIEYLTATQLEQETIKRFLPTTKKFPLGFTIEYDPKIMGQYLMSKQPKVEVPTIHPLFFQIAFQHLVELLHSDNISKNKYVKVKWNIPNDHYDISIILPEVLGVLLTDNIMQILTLLPGQTCNQPLGLWPIAGRAVLRDINNRLLNAIKQVRVTKWGPIHVLSNYERKHKYNIHEKIQNGKQCECIQTLDSSLITLANINWAALLLEIKRDTKNLATKLLTSELDLNQLDNIKGLEVNQLTDKMKENIVGALNEIKDNLTFYKDEVAGKGIKLLPEATKELNNLKEILDESGKLKIKESILSDSQKEDIKWFNIAILKKFFPQILSKSQFNWVKTCILKLVKNKQQDRERFIWVRTLKKDNELVFKDISYQPNIMSFGCINQYGRLVENEKQLPEIYALKYKEIAQEYVRISESFWGKNK